MSKRKRRRYDDEFRASAVLMLEAAGYPDTEGALTAVSRKTNTPLPTLHRWFHSLQNPPPSKLVNEKRRDLLEDITDLLFKHLEYAHDTIEFAEHSQIMTGLGILFDKRQLLTGGPTANENKRIVQFVIADRNDTDSP